MKISENPYWKAVKGTKQVTCSDWHRGWGIGHTKLGNLYKHPEHPDHYVWKGRSQGRHGQILVPTKVYLLRATEEGVTGVWDGNMNEVSTNVLPDFRDIAEAIRQLNS